MKIGQIVYTVNNQTGTVDVWQIAGFLGSKTTGKSETFVNLVSGRKMCFLPKKCVFETEKQALAVARMS